MSKSFTMFGPNGFDEQRLIKYFAVNVNDLSNTITFKYTIDGAPKTLGSIVMDDGLILQPLVLSFGSSSNIITMPYTQTSSTMSSLKQLDALHGSIAIQGKSSSTTTMSYAFMTAILNSAAGVTSTIIEPVSKGSGKYYISYNGYEYSMDYKTSLIDMIADNSADFNDNPTYTFKDVTSARKSSTITFKYVYVDNTSNSKNTTQQTATLGSIKMTNASISQLTVSFGTNYNITIPAKTTTIPSSIEDLGNLDATINIGGTSQTVSSAKALQIAIMNKVAGSTNSIIIPTFANIKYTMEANNYLIECGGSEAVNLGSDNLSDKFDESPTYLWSNIAYKKDIIRYFNFYYYSTKEYGSVDESTDVILQIQSNVTTSSLSTYTLMPGSGTMSTATLIANGKDLSFDDFQSLSSIDDLAQIKCSDNQIRLFCYAYLGIALSRSINSSTFRNATTSKTTSKIFVNTSDENINAVVNNAYSPTTTTNINNFADFASINYVDELDWHKGMNITIFVTFLPKEESVFNCTALVRDGGKPRLSTINITTGEGAEWGDKNILFRFYKVTQPSSAAYVTTLVASNMDKNGRYFTTGGKNINEFKTATVGNTINTMFNGSFPLIKTDAEININNKEYTSNTSCAADDSINGTYWAKKISKISNYACVEMYDNENYNPETNTVTS